MVFVKNNTPSDATIVIPPQQDPWLIGSGNDTFVRAFIYPRKIVQETIIIPDLKVFGPDTFILISWGKEECKPAGCHGWPRQDIRAKKIIYKDKPAFRLEIRPTRIASAVSGVDIKDIDTILFDLEDRKTILEINDERARSDNAFYWILILPEDFSNKYKEFKSSILKEIKSDKKIHNAEKIERITIIELDNDRKMVAVNDNYNETKTITKRSKWWKIFIEEIKARDIKPETRTDVQEISKDMVDYFNYNKEKCPIYINGKYKTTEIFTGRGHDAMLNPDIKIEIITERSWKLRCKKMSEK